MQPSGTSLTTSRRTGCGVATPIRHGRNAWAMNPSTARARLPILRTIASWLRCPPACRATTCAATGLGPCPNAHVAYRVIANPGRDFVRPTTEPCVDRGASAHPNSGQPRPGVGRPVRVWPRGAFHGRSGIRAHGRLRIPICGWRQTPSPIFGHRSSEVLVPQPLGMAAAPWLAPARRARSPEHRRRRHTVQPFRSENMGRRTVASGARA